MVLNDIAEAVEMHESTISRVTTQKYMHTPRGIFELKFFLQSCQHGGRRRVLIDRNSRAHQEAGHGGESR